jgi:Fe-S cluster assembly iron-binding protein IscA
MFQVTDRALDKMAELRDEQNAEEGQGLALVITDTQQLAVAVAEPDENDQVFERDGDPVVIVPAPMTDALDGLVLDYVDDGFALGRVD